MAEEEEGVSPEEIEAPATPTLPPPSEVIIIDQAYGTKTPTRGKRAAGTFKRPDLDPSAYSQGSSKSTRVWGIQWIPTLLLTQEEPAEEGNEARDYLYGYDFKEVTTANVFGDILVAFARPSNKQGSSLYVFSDNTKGIWESFSGSSSLGRSVRLLNGGRPFKDSDGAKYTSLHPTVPGGGWIFGPSYMPMWSTSRPVSAAGSITSVEFIESVFGE